MWFQVIWRQSHHGRCCTGDSQPKTQLHQLLPCASAKALTLISQGDFTPSTCPLDIAMAVFEWHIISVSCSGSLWAGRKVVITSLQTLLRRKLTGEKEPATELAPGTYTPLRSFSHTNYWSQSQILRLPSSYAPVVGVPPAWRPRYIRLNFFIPLSLPPPSTHHTYLDSEP